MSGKFEDLFNNPKFAALAARPVFPRLWKYYSSVADVLAGSSAIASIFPNTTDIGIQREWVYAEFLKNHLPSVCNVFLGGYVFGIDGHESKQMDVIITTNLSQRYNIPNTVKSLACIEGTLAVVCLKSNLNTAELNDSLANIASIPTLAIRNSEKSIESAKSNLHDNLPVKIIYAPKGMDGENVFVAVEEFYKANHSIPRKHWPDLIHVNKKYLFIKTPIDSGAPSNYLPLKDEDGALGLINAVYMIQDRILTSTKLELAYIEALVPLLTHGSLKTIFDGKNK
ncbi:MAG: hypothetical protein K2Y22_04040 [Candidatus Obscuribacterales bacterium]|nr:hypothetical protein [Candidatus Obscuribacterales bacterium]